MKLFSLRQLRRMISAALTAALLAPGAAAVVLSEDNLLYRTETTPSDGLRYETLYAEEGGTRQTGYLFTYTPGSATLPVYAFGEHIYGRETTSAMAKRLTADGARVVGGINGDFFSMATGIPIGIMIDGGTVLSSDAGENAIGIREDGTAIIGKPAAAATLRISSDDITAPATDIPIAHINKYPSVWGAYLCTPALGKTTHAKDPGREIVFRLDNGSFSVGGEITAEITELRENSADSEIPEDGFIIYIHPDAKNASDFDALAVGDVCTLTVSAAEGWEDVTLAIGGGDILVTDGTALHDGFTAEHADKKHPRTAVGYTADGSLLFFAADGRTFGIQGMTLAELADTMVSFGCVGALNLDGGGSTTVLVQAKDGALCVDNIPSDNEERKISNAILFVNTAEPDGIPAYAEITPGSPLVFRDAPVDLDITVYDRSMTPIPTENTETVWSANGGTVTEDGVFTPASDAPCTYTVTAQIRIPASSDENAEITAEAVLTASTTVYSVNTLSGLSSDVGEITVASGGVSAPVTLRGIRYGYDVILDVSDVRAAFVSMSGGEAIAPGGTADAPHICSWGYVDEALAVHNTASADDLAKAGTHRAFPTVHLALTVDGLTLYLPVTFGAAPLTVMQMEESRPATVFSTDSGGTLTRRANDGRSGTAAVSVNAHSVAPVTTPAADNPVRRIDLYVCGTLTADTHAVITCGDTEYTLPWVVSDDFTRLDGWKRISLDLTAAVPEGMSDFTITKLLASETRFSLVMDDLVYHFGDEPSVFVDIDTSWAKEDILTVSRMGVVNGIYSEANDTYSFNPTGLLTRAEFAVMVCGFLGLNTADNEAETRFSDQDSIPGWAYPYIRAVVSAGIMRGKSTETAEDGSIAIRFAAGDTMTRAEVIQVLGEILRQQLYADGGTFGSFAETAFADDASIPDWARANTVGIVGHGIVTGFSDNTIRPAATITRAEIAALLVRVNGVLADSADQQT